LFESVTFRESETLCEASEVCQQSEAVTFVAAFLLSPWAFFSPDQSRIGLYQEKLYIIKY